MKRLVHQLFEPLSTVTAYFWFMQLLTGLCIVAYGFDAYGRHSWNVEQDRFFFPAAITFVVANVLILRGSRIGYVGAIIGWILTAVLMAPIA